MLVIDASVALAWAFPDEEGAGPLAVLRQIDSESAIVPPIWPLEVANVLVGAERSGRLSKTDLRKALLLFSRLPIKVSMLGIELDSGLAQVVALARKHRLSSYDASYLELAIRTGSKLATLDRPLSKAANAEGVSLILD